MRTSLRTTSFLGPRGNNMLSCRHYRSAMATTAPRIGSTAAGIGIAVGVYGISFGVLAVEAGLSSIQAAVMSKLVIDESTAMARAHDDAHDARRAFLVTGVCVWFCWSAGTLAGACLGGVI